MDSNGTKPNLIEKRSFEDDMDKLDTLESLDAEELDEDLDEDRAEAAEDAFAEDGLSAEALDAQGGAATVGTMTEEEEDLNLDEIDNILELTEDKYPKFTLAKNKARFLRMVSWYRAKEEWIEVAPLSGVTKLFK